MTLFVKHRILFCLISFILGILLKKHLDPSVFVTLAVFFPFLILILKKNTLAFLAFIPLGIVLTVNYEPVKEIEHVAGKKVKISGVLERNPEIRENSVRLIVQIDEIENSGSSFRLDEKVVLYLGKMERKLYYGDRVSIEGVRLEKIGNFENPGSFDIDGFYKLKNIHYSAFASSGRLTIHGKSQSVNPILYQVNLFRMEYVQFARSVVPYPHSEIINALSVGDKSYLPSNLKDRFSALGLSHILAISGLHVGMFAFAFYFIIKWLLKRSEYLMLQYEVPRIAALMTILPVLLYTPLTGFSISSIRAAIMIVVYLIAIIIGKEEFKLNTLGFAGLLILVVNPNSLFDLAFQLSFLSVFGIFMIHLYYPFKIGGLKNNLLSVIKTTIAATFVTIPISLNAFGYLPVLTVPANLVVLPIVELLILPLCLLSVAAFMLSTYLAGFIMINANLYFVSFLLYITELFEKTGFAYLTVHRLGLFSIFLLYFLGLLILLQQGHRKLRYLLPPVFFLLVFINVVDVHHSADGQLEAYFLDSGRKNITVLKLPDSKKIVFNGGFSPNSRSDFIDRSVLIPFLLHERITSLDLVVYTSLDRSHLKGLNTLIKRTRPDELWINGSKLSNTLWESIYQKDIDVHKIHYEKDSFSSGDTEVVFYRQKNPYHIFDSKLPKPVLISINFKGSVIILGESIEKFSLSDMVSIKQSIKGEIKAVFLPELKYSDGYGAVIETFNPDVVVCKKCTGNNYPSERLKVYDTEVVGMVKIKVSPNGMDVIEHI